jgi:hypothetical protein
MIVLMYFALMFSVADGSVPERVQTNDASIMLADSAQIQGTWVLVKTDFDSGWPKGTRLVFRKGKFFATFSQGDEAGNYTQNEEKSPHIITLTSTKVGKIRTVDSSVTLEYYLYGDGLRLRMAGANVTFKRDKAEAGGNK